MTNKGESLKAKCEIDLEALRRFTGGEMSTAKELVDAFRQSMTDDHLPGIVRAIEAKSPNDLFYHAHTVKGSSGYLGANYVRWLSDRLAQVARNPQPGWESEAKQLSLELGDASRFTTDNLDRILSEHPNSLFM